MATRTLPQIANRRQSRTTVAAFVAVFIGIAITLVVALMIALAPATSIRLGTQDALGPMDDWYFRHLPAPAVLGENDDWGTRHRPLGR
jgi:hypothetical protein